MITLKHLMNKNSPLLTKFRNYAFVSFAVLHIGVLGVWAKWSMGMS